MECVLADEARDMGGEFAATDAELGVLISLYGDVDIYLSVDDVDSLLDYDAIAQEVSIPSPS